MRYAPGKPHSNGAGFFLEQAFAGAGIAPFPPILILSFFIQTGASLLCKTSNGIMPFSPPASKALKIRPVILQKT